MKKPQSNGLYRYWYKGKQFWGQTDKEAKEKRDNYKYECEHGIEKQEPITVIDLADKWMETKAGIDPRTYNQYATVMEKMTDTIGEKYVSAVSSADIKTVWKKFDGLSQSYISKGRFLFKGFFQYAMENNYCQSNPMLSDSAKPHSGTKGTHRCLTKTEQRLVETVPHRCQTAALVMMKAGLRRSEILALQKSDIHDNRIWVRKAIKFVNNRPVTGRTKNESSSRSVPLFASLEPFISHAPSGYILPDKNGGVCSETAFVRVWESYMTDLSATYNGCHKRWYHLTKEWKQEHPEEYAHYLELKRKDKQKAETYRLQGWVDICFRPHDLRHTFVTACRDKGIDIRVCMDWCGHGSEKMILEIYDHPSESRESTAVKLMEA